MKKSGFRFLSVLLFLSFILTACGQAANSPAAVPEVEEVKISVSGAFALYPVMVTWADEYSKLNPNVVFDVSGGGAGKGMSDALSGAVDIGMVSRSIAEEELAQGAYGVGVTKDAVFGTLSANNPYLEKILSQGLTRDTLAGIFLTGEITTWGQALGDPAITDAIHVYTRSDACGAAEMWVKYIGGKKQEELKGIGVNADPGLLEAVIKDPLGIGYNNLNYAYDINTGLPLEGAAVIPLDVNENAVVDPSEELLEMAQAIAAVNDGRYPSPPARILNLVTKGKPEGEVLNFISWILTDGQAFVSDAGYIQLTAEELAASQELLK